MKASINNLLLPSPPVRLQEVADTTGAKPCRALPVFPGEPFGRGLVMKGLALTACALAVLAGPLPVQAAGPIEQVTLRIDGVHGDDDGVAITNALRRVPSIKVASRLTAQNPF